MNMVLRDWIKDFKLIVNAIGSSEILNSYPIEQLIELVLHG